jgi:ferredoxin
MIEEKPIETQFRLPPQMPELVPVTPPEKNLLDNPLIGSFIRSRWFPGIFQWPTLAVFVLIMYQLVLGPASAHDNFGTALTWVLWWPLIPIIFLFLGRFWCAICPFATISDLVQKVVGNRRAVPKFLKKYGIWIIDAMFILITWSDHVFGVVESPVGSGVLMMGLTTGVVISGAFWERRTWCRYLCFLGGLSANYAQSGMLALRGTYDICKTCVAAACYKGTEKAPGCPLFEFPKTMTSNANCVVCGDCVKNCPNNSLRLTLRLPTQELWFVHKPRLEVAFLAVVIMGIVFVQNVTMLEIWGSMLAWLERVTGTDSYAVTFTITFLIAMLIPVSLLAGTALVGKKINGESIAKNFTRFGYAIIPLDMAAHIGHNLFHLLAEGKSILFTGVALFGREIQGISPALMGSSSIQMLQYALIVLGSLGSLFVAYKISQRSYGERALASFAPYALLILFLMVVNIVLFMLPMSMRM